MKNLKKVLALVLTLGMMVSVFSGCSSSSSSSTESNSDTSDEAATATEEEDRTLSIVICTEVDQSDVIDGYTWQYLSDLLDIEFDITEVTISGTAIEDYKQIAFLSSDIPDIFLRMNFSTSDIVNYGIEEGVIMSLSPYIEDGSMPNLAALIEQHGDPLLSKIQAYDGNIYSLGCIKEQTPADGPYTGALSHYNLKQTWLDELGLETPTTVDEFLDMLRAFKAAYPDSTPFGGTSEDSSGFAILMTAYGALPNPVDGMQQLTDPVVIGDRASFFYAEEELYTAFVETYHTMYEEGLISPDFFTMDSTTFKAQIANHEIGVFGNDAISVYDVDNYMDWWYGVPMTSEYNDDQIWTESQGYYNMGLAVVSSSCENPDVAVEFLDALYDPEIALRTSQGPYVNDEEKYGLEGWDFIDGTRVYYDVENGSANSEMDYQTTVVRGLMYQLGYYPNNLATSASIVGAEYEEAMPDAEVLSTRMRAAAMENMVEYYEDGYPTVVYFDEATTQTVTDLKSVIEDYVENQFAMFVTGVRPIEELSDYFEELDAMGYQEYASVYIDYYANLSE